MIFISVLKFNLLVQSCKCQSPCVEITLILNEYSIAYTLEEDDGCANSFEFKVWITTLSDQKGAYEEFFKQGNKKSLLNEVIRCTRRVLIILLNEAREGNEDTLNEITHKNK